MNTQDSWDKEYKQSKLVTQHRKPQKDLLRFLQWIKNNKHIDMRSGITVLDLGCGIGRNGYYLVDEYEAEVFGYDISNVAIEKGQKMFADPQLHLAVRGLSEVLPHKTQSVDMVIDVMASQTLSSAERKKYLAEIARVLKSGGYLYVRTFAKEGDKNAQKMCKDFPGKEPDTYVHPQLEVQERIFSGPDLKGIYGEFFDVVRMERKTGYQKWGNQSYKRNYWNVYLTTKGL